MTCKTTGKRCYGKKNGAHKVMRHSGGRGGKRIYLCDFCHTYHLTSQYDTA